MTTKLEKISQGRVPNYRNKLEKKRHQKENVIPLLASTKGERIPKKGVEWRDEGTTCIIGRWGWPEGWRKACNDDWDARDDLGEVKGE